MEAHRTVLALALVALLAAPALAAQAPARATFLPAPEGFVAYRGDLHAHTSYSDGVLLPEDAFATASGAGFLDFFAVTDHSEWLVFPFRADPACVSPDVLGCYASPLPDGIEWDDTLASADAASNEAFAGLRGFEWSSPIQGHVNVFFSDSWTDFAMTGGATMDGLYAWLEHLAGERVIATFNHPGREPLVFGDFAYVEDLDPIFAAVEAFNRGNDHSDWYLRALERGWHVGAVGVTDGHGPGNWVDASDGRTVLLADALTPDGIRDALLAMRTVATLGTDLDARFTVDGKLMGSTVGAWNDDAYVEARVSLLDAGGEPFTRVELLGSDGFSRSVDVSGASPEVVWRLRVGDIPMNDLWERFLVVRAHQADGAVVVTSPVWIRVLS